MGFAILQITMKGKKLLLLFFFILIFFSVFKLVGAGSIDSLLYMLVHPGESGTKQAVVSTKAECVKLGGVWGRAGLFPKEFCRIPYKDGMKFCIAGFMCESGMCVAPMKNLRRPAIFATGTCATYRSTFGCFHEVHFGLTDGGICRD